MYPGLAVINPGISSREGVQWEAGVRRALRGQPRVSTKTNNCVRASSVTSVCSLWGKAAAAYIQGVVEVYDSARSRLSEVVVLFERSERVTKCRGQQNREIQLEISSGSREKPFQKPALLTSEASLFGSAKNGWLTTLGS